MRIQHVLFVVSAVSAVACGAASTAAPDAGGDAGKPPSSGSTTDALVDAGKGSSSTSLGSASNKDAAARDSGSGKDSTAVDSGSSSTASDAAHPADSTATGDSSLVGHDSAVGDSASEKDAKTEKDASSSHDADHTHDAGHDASDAGATHVAGEMTASPMFGFSESSTAASDWPAQSYGMQRFWDSPPLQWPSINTASGVFDFTNLDADLALAYTKGTMEGFYTLARTPPWATSKPTDTTCNYVTASSGGGDGECDAPSDLNADGSGTNAIWKAWIMAIATHVNGATYLQTHAHIRYWEIWNEPDTEAFWAGSIAQLARLVEDANCIITGRGVVHENGNGTATTCTATPIDPTAQIVMPSAHAKTVALEYGQNELYCSASPTGYQLPCPNPPDAIANAVDIINFHMKPGNETGNACPAPTLCTEESAMEWYVSNIKGILKPAELAKPLWDGEAQYSTTGFTGTYTDPDMAASFMPRFYLTDWSLGISGTAWYNEPQEPSSVPISYQQTYNWMVGSTLTTPCSAKGTVWSCTITKVEKPYLIMWDTAQTCSGGTCTTSNQIVADEWTTYQDMTTASTPVAIPGSTHVIPVGIKPVVLAM